MVILADNTHVYLPMIDLDTVPRRLTPKMPVDFAAYLLSSSPPATNLELLSYAFSQESSRNWALNRPVEDTQNTDEIPLQQNLVTRGKKGRKSLKPIILKKDDSLNETDCTGSDSACSSGPGTPTSPCSPGKTSKKVSFADHKGYALATVKIMAEPSDQPPRLGAEIFKKLTNGAEAEVTGLPPFKINFTQPASDYLAFREKIERNNVSLENAILRDYNLIGTIKVKNLSFEKRVYVKCTFDSWVTTQNFEAKYVQPVGANSNHSFDTFSFEFDISTEMDPHNTIQFAVCFETPANQFWDNNSGQNYEIIPTDFNCPFSNVVQGADNKKGMERRGSWTEYNCWRHVDTSTPYY